MATKSIAFRLNDKNREDKEIMEWLDKAVYEDSGNHYQCNGSAHRRLCGCPCHVWR